MEISESGEDDDEVDHVAAGLHVYRMGLGSRSAVAAVVRVVEVETIVVARFAR